MKICYGCKLMKELDLFKKDQSGKSGRANLCKSCHNIRVIEYHRTSNVWKTYYERYMRENKVKISIRVSLRKKATRGLNNAYENKRRATKLNATPRWLTAYQLDYMKMLYVNAKAASVGLGIDFEVDHIIPLRGKNVRGLHVPWNLQIITAAENIRKFNKCPEAG